MGWLRRADDSIDSDDEEIHGTVADGYEAVREEFAAFVAEEEFDYEGQLCAHVHGRRVVDLWVSGDDAGPESLYGVYSSTKGAAHLVVALLVQEGTLELDRKVTYYWPEFAAEGKGALTLRELLAHRAGVIGTDAGFTAGAGRRPADRRTPRRPAAVLASGHRLRLPRAGHRRADRRDCTAGHGPYAPGGVRGAGAGPLWARLLPGPASGARAALPHRAADGPTPEQRALLDSAAHRAAHARVDRLQPPRRRAHRPGVAAQPPRDPRAKGPASVGGVASARGLAGLYAAAISEVGRQAPLLKPDTVAEFGQFHSAGYDLVARAHKSFGLGFQTTADLATRSWARARSATAARAARQAFADPRSGLAYGYTRRRFAFPGGAAPENDAAGAGRARGGAGAPEERRPAPTARAEAAPHVQGCGLCRMRQDGSTDGVRT